MKWLVVLLLLAGCGFPRPAEHQPDAGSGSGTECTFDQSAFDQCVFAP